MSTCGAASPAPFAARIVSTRSSQIRWSSGEPSSCGGHLARPLPQGGVADLDDRERRHTREPSPWRRSGGDPDVRRRACGAVQDVALARLDLGQIVAGHHLAQDDEAAEDHGRARRLEAGYPLSLGERQG